MNTLAALLNAFQNKRVIVVGDLMLDEYLWGYATRISQEAPVMVVDADRETHVPGGAANVAHNLVALGAQSAVVGVIGSDYAGEDLKEKLHDLRIGTQGLVVDESRRTTRKTRIIAHNQQVLRVDQEKREPVDEATAQALLSRLEEMLPSADAVILSDYRKGCLQKSVIQNAIALANRLGKPLTTNPKPDSASLYAGASLLSLNRPETEGLVGRSLPNPDAVLDCCRNLPSQLDVRALVVTLGEQGMVVLDQQTAEYIPALRVEVYDTAGAGDTVIATITLAMAAGASLQESARLATLAGACVVRHVGVATPTPDELRRLAQSAEYSL